MLTILWRQLLYLFPRMDNAHLLWVKPLKTATLLNALTIKLLLMLPINPVLMAHQE